MLQKNWIWGCGHLRLVSKNLALVRENHGTVKRLMFTQSFAMLIHSAKDQVSKQHVCCFDKLIKYLGKETLGHNKGC